MERLAGEGRQVDHAGGAAEMKEKSGVPIIGPHPDDLFWIEGIPAQGQMFGLPEARTFTRRNPALAAAAVVVGALAVGAAVWGLVRLYSR